MSLTIILSIIIIHWFADFVMQDEKWATNKSKSNIELFKHVITYSLIWLWVGCMTQFNKSNCLLFGDFKMFKLTLSKILLFFIITFICHFITDYITSRIVSKKFAKQEYGSSIPNTGAFTVIGWDQVLHYVQLFITYKLLFL